MSKSRASRAAPVTLAKFSRPRLYNVLKRERLFARIDALRAHPILWIAGPPGAGKSTLVGSYVVSRKQNGIWFQTDAGDADPGTFFHYFTLAAADLAGGRTKRLAALPRFGPEYASDLTTFTRRFMRAFFGLFPAGALLVVDNFHEAPANAAWRFGLAKGFASCRRASTSYSFRALRHLPKSHGLPPINPLRRSNGRSFGSPPTRPKRSPRMPAFRRRFAGRSIAPAKDGPRALCSCASICHATSAVSSRDIPGALAAFEKLAGVLNAATDGVRVFPFSGVVHSRAARSPSPRVNAGLALYRGHFLSLESAATRALPLRDRLQAKLSRSVLAEGQRLESYGEFAAARALYERALELDNLAEAIYRRLMVCQRELGDPAGALTTYRRCRELLSIVLNRKPAAETEALRASLNAV